MKPKGLPSSAIARQLPAAQAASREIIRRGPASASKVRDGRKSTKAIIRALRGFFELEVESDTGWKVVIIITLTFCIFFGGIAGLIILADHLNLFNLLARGPQ